MKITSKKAYSTALFLAYFYSFWIEEGRTEELIGNNLNFLRYFSLSIIMMLLFIKFCLDIKKIHKFHLFFGFISIGVGICTYISSGNNWITLLMVFLAFSYDIDIKEIINSVFWALTLSVIPIILLSLFGTIPNITQLKTTGDIGYSLGFYSPNIAAVILIEFL